MSTRFQLIEKLAEAVAGMVELYADFSKTFGESALLLIQPATQEVNIAREGEYFPDDCVQVTRFVYKGHDGDLCVDYDEIWEFARGQIGQQYPELSLAS